MTFAKKVRDALLPLEDTDALDKFSRLWVQALEPTMDVMNIPAPTLRELYPNIMRFGPDGDAVMDFADNLILMFQQNDPIQKPENLVQQAKTFHTQAGQKVLDDVTRFIRSGRYPQEGHPNFQKRQLHYDYTEETMRLGIKLGLLANGASSEYAYYKDIGVNDKDTVDFKLGIESMLWVLVSRSGAIPAMKDRYTNHYKRVDRYVTRVRNLSGKV